MLSVMVAALVAAQAPGLLPQKTLPNGTVEAKLGANQPKNEVCELHIWPAGKSLAVIEYNILLAGRDRAFIGSGGNRPRPKILEPYDQRVLLQQLSLPSLLKLPTGTSVILHDEPLEREKASASKRHSSSASRCQGELLIHSIVYESTAQVARSLRVTMTYQLFTEGQELPSRRFTTSAKSRLEYFPAKKAAEVSAANADLESAFRNAVLTFTKYANTAAIGDR